MSTLKVEQIQHPDSSTPAISLDSSGAMSGSFPYPNRNLLINGDMRIAQRGSQTGMAENAYAVDRFRTRTYGGAGRYSSDVLSTDVPSGTNFTYSTKWTVGTAATDVGTYGYSIEQLVEGYNSIHVGWGTAESKKLTLSFWVKVSESGTYCTGLRTANGIYSDHRELSLTANTWTRVEETFEPLTQDLSAASISRFTNGIGIIVDIIGLGGQTSKTSDTTGQWISGNYVWTSNQTNWMATAGNTVFLTGVQLEIGSVATEFEHRSYGDELARCQRYYYRATAVDNGGMFGSGLNYNATASIGLVTFPVTMRTKPSSLETTGSSADYRVFVAGGSINCNGVPTYDGGHPNASTVQFPVASGLTSGQSSILRSASTSAYLAWSAEL